MAITPQQRKTIEEWLVALRSGEWKQTQNELWDDSSSGFSSDEVASRGEQVGYCCLGVLCKLNGLNNHETSELNGIEIEYTNGSAIHPQRFNELVGLELRDVPYIDDDGDWGPEALDVESVFPGSYAADLAALNDGGSTFAEIADFIEERATKIDPEWRTR